MSSRIKAVLAWLAKQVPGVVVLGGLAALGVWGHHSGWKLPSPTTWGKEEEKEEKKDEGKDPGAIVLADDDSARDAGLEHSAARRQPLAQLVEAPAVLAFEQQRHAQLAPRASGTAWRVLRSAGDPVKAGQLLALVAAPDVGTAKTDFLTNYVAYEVRLKALERLQAAGDAIPERQIREAELALREARVRMLTARETLLNLSLPIHLEDLKGLDDEQITRKVRLLGLPANLAAEKDLPGNLLPLVAPFDGAVVRTTAVVGEVLSPTQPVFVVADGTWLRVNIDVRLEDVGRLARGQEVTFESRATGQSVTGELKWISPEVDAKTRTVLARATVYNPEGLLRPATFGKARIVVGRNAAALTVPDSALQWDSGLHRVFVRLDERTFDPRIALLGTRAAGHTELLDARVLLGASLAGTAALPAGPLPFLASLPISRRMLLHVRPGDRVVTTGSHVLKCEMHKDRISGDD
jgi:cobalt-zinc-cadmium efflux system membrane fusion protein